MTRWACLLLSCVVLLPGGCNRLETAYGKSTGRSGKSSLNGFGGLRALYQLQDWRARSISRVGPRVDKLETIVWVPTVNTPLSGEVSQWFDQWLAGDGKTLIHVVYDGGSEAVYWRQAARFAAPLQRLEYRRRAARAEIQQLQETLQQPVPESNGWFQIRKLQPPQSIGQPAGPWAADDAVRPSTSDGETATTIEVRYTVEPYKEPQKTGAGTPAATPWMAVDERSDVPTELQPLLMTESGVPLVTRITSPEWGDSRVLVVSAGSLLTNYGLTQPLGRSLAAHLVAASGPPGEAGFLSSDWSGVDVSSVLDGKAAKSGMELLTVWPLSLVTIHAALLGLVVCLILMPIFGRPRNPRHHSQSDFADHLDAVAALLGRTGGEHYARQRISEYMRRVRGETAGPWVLAEPQHPTAARPPHDAAPPSPPAVAVPDPSGSSSHDHASPPPPGDDR